MFGLHTDRVSIEDSRDRRPLFDWYDSCDRMSYPTKSTRRETPFFERDERVCHEFVNFAHAHRTPPRSSAGEATYLRSTRAREREDDIETTLELHSTSGENPTDH